MRFQLVVGPSFTVCCNGCQESFTAGTELYRSASSGKMTRPAEIYQAGQSYFCQGCALSHAEGHDDTRSTNTFFSDTRGLAF